MAESKEGELYWHSPDPRAIIPLGKVHPSRSQRAFERKVQPTYSIDARFPEVIRECANREETWINDEIIVNYEALHRLGFAHSVEIYIDEKLAGGLYGVALGGAFFGESMFSRVSNASKSAFYFLVGHLKRKGFVLLDTQYLNDHTASLGAIEISRSAYLRKLRAAIKLDVKF